MDELKELLLKSMEVLGNTDEITVNISQRLDKEILNYYIGGNKDGIKNS